MKKTLLLITAFCALGATGAHAQLLLGWDFTGEPGNESTFAETSVANNMQDSTLSRGSSATGATLNNTFETAAFGNSGVPSTGAAAAIANNYFQFNVQAATGDTLSLSSIQGIFGGTISYESASGVTMELAYSLDGGNTFSLLPSTITTAGNSDPTSSVDLSSVSALQNVDSVTFRLFASGGTATGKWGFDDNSGSSSQFVLGSDGSKDGLIVNGTVGAVPEPSTWVLMAIGALSILALQRRGLFQKSIRTV